MSILRTYKIRGVEVTLESLTRDHYYRLQGHKTERAKPPKLPDTYTHDKALQYVESYKDDWENYETQEVI